VFFQNSSEKISFGLICHCSSLSLIRCFFLLSLSISILSRFFRILFPLFSEPDGISEESGRNLFRRTRGRT